MPNWKTYESSVRLLSAIVAAHPELKLNYADIANYYGASSSYHSIWRRMTLIRGHADVLRKAFDEGIDPETVELKESALGVAPKQPGVSPKKRSTPKKLAKEEDDDENYAISKAFGGDCTRGAIDNRFRKIKTHAVLINKALARGEDPFTLPIDDKGSDAAATPKSGGEIAATMGSDVTPGGIKFQIHDRIRPLAKKQAAMRSSGLDPKDVDLGAPPKTTPNGKASASKDAISKHFGSDSTGGGIEFQFRKIKSEAKRQRACVSSGGDPLSLGIGSVGGTDAISQNFGEGTTPKALSGYFERVRKDPQYNLGNTIEENSAGAPASTTKAGSARKRAAPASSGKKRPAKAAKMDTKEDDAEEGNRYESDEETIGETPSKKAQPARVSRPRAKRRAPGFFQKVDDTDSDLIDIPLVSEPTATAKTESVAVGSNANNYGGYGEANGNGNTNGRSPTNGKKGSYIPPYYVNGVLATYPPYGNGTNGNGNGTNGNGNGTNGNGNGTNGNGNGTNGNGNGYGAPNASFSGFDQDQGDYLNLPEDEGGA